MGACQESVKNVAIEERFGVLFDSEEERQSTNECEKGTQNGITLCAFMAPPAGLEL